MTSGRSHTRCDSEVLNSPVKSTQISSETWHKSIGKIMTWTKIYITRPNIYIFLAIHTFDTTVRQSRTPRLSQLKFTTRPLNHLRD